MLHFTIYVNAKIDVCILNFPKQLVTYFFLKFRSRCSTERLLCKENSTFQDKMLHFPLRPQQSGFAQGLETLKKPGNLKKVFKAWTKPVPRPS